MPDVPQGIRGRRVRGAAAVVGSGELGLEVVEEHVGAGPPVEVAGPDQPGRLAEERRDELRRR